MKKISFTILGLCLCLFASAQKVVIKGDLKCLKDVDAVSFAFTTNNMQVGKMSEADYVAKKLLTTTLRKPDAVTNGKMRGKATK